MITAKEIMTTEVVTLSPDTGIIDAAKMLLENGINGAPVVDADGRLLGILCRSDLLAQQKKITLPYLFTMLGGYIPLSSTKKVDREVRKIAALAVSEAMTADPTTVEPDTRLDTIASLMVDHHFYSLPVLDKGRLVGIVGKEDVLKTLLQLPKAGA